MTFRKGIISVCGVFDLGASAHGHVNSAESSFRTSCARANTLGSERGQTHTHRAKKREIAIRNKTRLPTRQIHYQLNTF